MGIIYTNEIDKLYLYKNTQPKNKSPRQKQMEWNPKGFLGKIIKENEIRAGEIAQQVKVFAEAWLPKFNTGNHI